MKTIKKLTIAARNRRIARVIADFLFTNGQGDHANRLQLVLPDLTNGGGWSETAVADHVARILDEEA